MLSDFFAYVVDGVIKQQGIRRGSNFNGKSLGMKSPDSTYIAMGLYPMTGEKPDYDAELQTCTGPVLVFDAGNQAVNRVYTVSQKTQAEIDADVAEAIKIRKKEVDAIRDEKVYSDIPADFAGTPGVIQFRNEEDRMNLTNVTQGAQVSVTNGNPSQVIIYRDKANVRHSVTAAQMLSIGASALQGKQAIAVAAWDHKDAIKLLTSVSAIKAYDINTGWPV